MSNALGIDLGSSKIAAVLVDESGRTLDAVSVLLPERDAEAAIVERDPQSIFAAVHTAVKGLDGDALRDAKAIGVCGQMHGVVLWNDLEDDHSPLVTWEDRRSEEGTFLADLRQEAGLKEIHSGYGVVTLAWLQKNDPRQLERFQYAGTIMDYLVARCCGKPAPVMDPTNAAGWGFFDSHTCQWVAEAFIKTGVDPRFLPNIQPTGSLAGSLTESAAQAWGMTVTPPLMVACGDNPAAVFSCHERMDDGIFLNVGTGSQMAVVVAKDALSGLEQDIGIEVRPFLDDRYLAVASSVCGGQSFLWLVETVEGWCHELGVIPPERDLIYERINALGVSCKTVDLPEFLPFFKAERHHPGMLGSISGMAWDNVSLGAVSKAMARGMIDSLWSLFPRPLLHGKAIVIGTGNGIRRSPLLRKAAEDVTGLNLEIPELHEEAATGAARMAIEHLT